MARIFSQMKVPTNTVFKHYTYSLYTQSALMNNLWMAKKENWTINIKGKKWFPSFCSSERRFCSIRYPILPQTYKAYEFITRRSLSSLHIIVFHFWWIINGNFWNVEICGVRLPLPVPDDTNEFLPFLLLFVKMWELRTRYDTERKVRTTWFIWISFSSLFCDHFSNTFFYFLSVVDTIFLPDGINPPGPPYLVIRYTLYTSPRLFVLSFVRSSHHSDFLFIPVERQNMFSVYT